MQYIAINNKNLMKGSGILEMKSYLLRTEK